MRLRHSQADSAGRREGGQSLVETVVFLPVLVLIFLGMFYLKGLLDTKARAIEAARYLSWENAWWVREGNTGRGVKSDAQLEQELRRLGLGDYLFRVRGAQFKETTQVFRNRMQAQNPVQAQLLAVPAFIDGLFNNGFGGSGEPAGPSNPGSDAAGGNTSSSGGSGIPGLDLGGIDNALFDLAAFGGFALHGFFAYQTNWDTEERESVITSEVVYRYRGPGGAFAERYVRETSSVLSHPFNIKRGGGPTSSDANTEELNRLIGEEGICDNSEGHIFHLWLFPTGPFPPLSDYGTGTGGGNPFTALSTLGTGAKCLFTAAGGIGSTLSSALGPFGGNLGYRLPNGTLKEYPELDMPADTGSTSDAGGGTGSGVGGGNTALP